MSLLQLSDKNNRLIESLDLVCRDAQLCDNGAGLNNRKLGAHIMKKGLLSLLIVLVLVWNCSTVFAQGKGKGAGGSRPSEGLG